MIAETVVPRIIYAPPATEVVDVTTLRASVFAWALARSQGGDFVLCVDDLAGAGTRPGVSERVLDALGWLGVDWDEGPHRRSQRRERYQTVADRLLENGHAYHGDDNDSLRLSLPQTGQTVVEDALRGPLTLENAAMVDPVLLDADGVPRFLLADAVDVHDMAVSHAVFDAREVASAPLRARIFRALGWEEPVWVHLPAVVEADGERADYPLSRLQEAGYLPETLFNYLLLLGWSPAGGDEIVGKWEVRQQFSLEDVAPDPAGFDWDHFKRINRHYLQRKSDSALAALMAPFLEEAYGDLPTSEAWLVQLAGLIREQLDTPADAVGEAEWAFSDLFMFSEAAEQALAAESSRPVLVQLVAELAHVVLLDEQTAQRILQSLHARHALSEADVTRPVRAALTGAVDGPPLPAIMGLLGKQRCLQRIAAILR